MFYSFNQHNSGEEFVVNDKVCHCVIVEADSLEEAIEIAENIGCYWDGVSKGIDCECCGDRWSRNAMMIDVETLEFFGTKVSCMGNDYESMEDEWWRLYGKYDIMTPPKKVQRNGYVSYVGKVVFHNIEEYAQYAADLYGGTTPAVRIYYKDGTVKEIFKET
jgi:hypothetical protein